MLTAPPIGVFVHSVDPILHAGVTTQLRGRGEVHLADDLTCANVAIVAADEVDEETARTARVICRNGCSKVVLVIARLDETGLFAGVEAGASGFLRRCEAIPDRLVHAVVAAADGEATVPPDLIAQLLCQIRSVLTGGGSRGLALSGLSERETEVLRLVADGLDTAEIASRLSYSERTVKGGLHQVTTRLHLRNRSQAVAYAVRQGLI